MNIRRFIAGIIAVCLIGVIVLAVKKITKKTADNTAVTDNAVITESEPDEYTEGTEKPLKYKKYGDHIEISGCNESAIAVVIPSEIDGLPVTIIGKFAFQELTGLKKITIPDSVTSIDDYAFWWCNSLTEVIIPDSVTNIGDSAFSGCKELTEVTIPDSVTSFGDHVFLHTPWLESRQVENPLVIINRILIDGTSCSGDEVIPDNVTSICDSAFSGCKELTAITIPDGVTKIGNRAFEDCTGLAEITIPNSVTSIGNCSFNKTPWLESRQAETPLVIINGILIDGTACSGDVIIPNGVTSINDFAFDDCEALTGIMISDSVTSIGMSSFENCTSLTKITVPDNITSIGFWAFYGCTELTEITILNPNCEIYNSEHTLGDNATIYGYENSTAQAYAEKYNRKFVSLG